MAKNILVTGGTGFIGRWVVNELRKREYGTIVLDRRHELQENDVLPDEFFFGDVTDSETVTEAMAHADGFIHLAAVLGTQETITNPRPAAKANLMGGLNILEAAVQYDIPGVYIGVGNHWMNNTYSISKTMIERFIDMFNRYRGARVNIVRAMNAYGPGQSVAAPYGSSKVRKITPSFCCRALLGHDIEIYGDGSQVSDMVWVGDVAKALVSAYEHAARNEASSCGRVWEIGPPERDSRTVLQVAQMINHIAGGRSQIVHLPMRPGEEPNARVSSNTAPSEFEEIGIDIYDLMPLSAGMAVTVDYFEMYLKEQGLLENVP